MVTRMLQWSNFFLYMWKGTIGVSWKNEEELSEHSDLRTVFSVEFCLPCYHI